MHFKNGDYNLFLGEILKELGGFQYKNLVKIPSAAKYILKFKIIIIFYLDICVYFVYQTFISECIYAYTKSYKRRLFSVLDRMKYL